MIVENLNQFKKWIKENYQNITVIKTTKMNERDKTAHIERKILAVQTSSIIIDKSEICEKSYFDYPKASEITFNDLTDNNGVRSIVNNNFGIMIHHWILNK